MKKILRRLLMIICICVFCFSSYKIADYYYGAYKNKKLVSELQELVKEEPAGKKMTFSEKYKDLLDRNSDFVGWIKMEDTVIDYPIMYTPYDEEFYLRRDFDKAFSWRGTLFFNLESDLKEESDNMIIYGHNMDDGSMFHDLEKYRQYDFYKKHPTFKVETIYHSNTYEIFAVFKTADDLNNPIFIDYYHFYNVSNQQVFDEQIAKYKQKSFYDTGITPKFGDKLITLSTCEYSNENGRLVVVARKVEK